MHALAPWGGVGPTLRARRTHCGSSGFPNARDAISGGDYTPAEEWLAGVPVADRAPELVAQVEYAMAKALLSQLRWEEAELRLATASKTCIDPLHSERLGLVRNRSKLLDDHVFGTMGAAVDRTMRLSERALAPTVKGVWACGAYFSRGHRSGMSWSRFLRGAKEATEDREAMLHLACGYLCRFTAGRTPLLGLVDVVGANINRTARDLPCAPAGGASQASFRA